MRRQMREHDTYDRPRPTAEERKERRKHLAECHSCPRNGKGDPYCWQTCRGPAEASNKGVSYVNTDDMESPDEFIYSRLDAEAKAECDARDGGFVFFDEPEREPPPSGVTKELEEETERALAVVLAKLFALPDIQLCILRHLLFGEDYATIGRTLPRPISKEAVQKNLVQMRDRNPFVLKVMEDMQIKGEGGAKRKQAYNLEFDL